MSLIPGVNLEGIWSKLDSREKENIRSQLDSLLSSLRSLPCPADRPLGGVQGEGCKDIRRGLRTSSEPILTEEQFREFIFTGSTIASPLYTELLHKLMPAPSGKGVFTHGDLRPANIVVDTDDHKDWKVSGILDWEASGFYPAYWESIKMTNNLTPRDTLDWYKYLPASISFQKFTVQWLVDRLWDPLMENS
uniref:Aminoglycoside phosphotransferase domain-containing protein n=1 Tax=Bionectria ochroleuca TaxID=29856 RepID=A0A8H7K4H1_BIOOC